MMGFSDNFISGFILDTDKCIRQVLSQYDQDLQDVLWEFMKDGKRIRPFILASITKVLNGDRALAVRLAASVEIYHNATLIYDDIQDNSLMRRGKPTLHARFGPGIAISYASVLRSLMTKPFAESLPPDLSLHVYQWINRVAALLSLGQYREMMWAYKKDLQVSERDYLEMVRYKTGALIGLSAVLGCITASKREVEKLFEFGCNLGIAYQIIDDVRNVDTNSNQKKDKYSDIYERKVTLLVVHALSQNKSKWKNDLVTIFSKNEVTESDVTCVLQILKDSCAIEYCRKVAKNYVQKAIDLLLKLPGSNDNARDKFITNIEGIFKHA